MLRADLFLRFFASSIGVTVNHGMSLQYDYLSRKQFRYSGVSLRNKNSLDLTSLIGTDNYVWLLSTEDKDNYLEHLFLLHSCTTWTASFLPEALALMRMGLRQKEVVELKAMFSKQAEQELLQTVREFHTCKQEEGQSVSSHVLKMKGYIDTGAPRFVQDFNMHDMGKTVNELHAMLKVKEKEEQEWAIAHNNVPFALHPKSSTHQRRITQQRPNFHQRVKIFTGQKELPVYLAELMKKGRRTTGKYKAETRALSLYVAMVIGAAVEAIELII
ncbi:hypothetical protein Tco_1490520 [Tanacetum coccineum]